MRQDTTMARREWIVAAIAVVVVSCIWLLAAQVLFPDSDPAAILVVPAVILAAVPAVLMLRGQRADIDADRALNVLQRLTRQDRERFLRGSVRLTHRSERPNQRLAMVGFRLPLRGNLPEEAEEMLLHWQKVGGHALQGTLATIAEFYESLETRRLVIMGAPGAGKTVVASRLALDLMSLATRSTKEEKPIPVWVPLTSYFPRNDVARRDDAAVRTHFRDWLIDQITEATQQKSLIVRRLLQAGRLLPILDGLDEMHPADSRLVVRALNSASDDIVVTCRITDYAAMVGSSAGQVVVDATHVVLQPLSPKAVTAYLTARYSSTHGIQERWRPVLAALAMTDHWVSEYLALPWHLSLYTATYDATDSDPAVLLETTPANATNSLIAGLAGAITRTDPVANQRGWTGAEVDRWLSVVARHIHSSDETTTALFLPAIWRLGGRWPRWVLPGIYVAVALAVSVRLTLTRDWALLPTTSPLFFSAWFCAKDFAPLRRFDVRQLRTRGFLRAMASNVAGGLAFGLAVGLLVWAATGDLVLGLALGLPGFLASAGYGFLDGLAGDLVLARPSLLIRQAAIYTLIAIATFGLVFGLAIGLAVGTERGLDVGLQVALTIGLWYGSGQLWVRYLIGVAWSARRRTSPWRIATFFDWCLENGIMRQTGVVLEFRHRELLDWYTHRPSE